MSSAFCLQLAFTGISLVKSPGVTAVKIICVWDVDWLIMALACMSRINSRVNVTTEGWMDRISVVLELVLTSTPMVVALPWCIAATVIWGM